MATYQFLTYVLPPVSQNSWKGIDPTELICDIDSIIKRASRCDSTIWKSEIESFDHDVSMDLNDNKSEIEDFRFRTDLRDQSQRFLDGMLTLCAKHGLQLKSIDGDIIEAEKSQFLSIAHKSPAFKFVSNPTKFLDDLL